MLKRARALKRERALLFYGDCAMEQVESKKNVYLYDTTLRDGSQGRGISFSVNDKLKIAGLLADFGIPYLEGGWPGSNPKDCEFFRAMRRRNLGHSRVVAFGSTRRKGLPAAQDLNLQALVRAETPVVAVVGKTWPLHVTRVLETTLTENLDMIRESIAFLKQEGREVIFDAEHFFDAWRMDPQYAHSVLDAAQQAGADWLVLCDTNGGSLPHEIEAVVLQLWKQLGYFPGFKLGIHAHNDSDLAVANSLAAVRAGCTQVQGTINGYGERCGNANLISVLANLSLKLARPCVGIRSLTGLTELSHRVSEIANMNPEVRAPFVGTSAFAHKGGIHVAAVEKIAESYEHISPACVGNCREVLVSELSGRGNIRMRAAELGLTSQGIEKQVLDQIKELESRGFQFEEAEGSFELLIQRTGSSYKYPFEVVDVMVVSNRQGASKAEVQAIVKLRVGEQLMHTAASGSGPVHALDGALRKALQPYYPGIAEVRLTDYKVRILDPEQATAATTRVVIEASCGDMSWSTVGCSENIVDASLHALTDSLEYYLLKHGGMRCEGTALVAANTRL